MITRSIYHPSNYCNDSYSDSCSSDHHHHRKRCDEGNDHHLPVTKLYDHYPKNRKCNSFVYIVTLILWSLFLAHNFARVEGGSCAGLTYSNQTLGVITDGMGNYAASMDCAWLLYSDLSESDNIISLKFTQFRTECGWDFFTVFDGNSTDAPMIGSFTGSNPPPLIVSSGPTLLAKFHSDKSGVEAGFVAQYWISRCPLNCTFPNGVCNDMGQCECRPGYLGIGCEMQDCSSACPMNGIACHDGICICPNNRQGNDCEMETDTPLPGWIKENTSVIGDIEFKTHTSLFMNGKLYIFEGFTLYSVDMVTKDWTRIIPRSGRRPFHRLGPSFIGIESENIFVLFGGRKVGQLLDDLWIFNLTDKTWHEIEHADNELKPYPLFGHEMIYVPTTKKVYLYGGLSSFSKIHKEIYCLDIVTYQWEILTIGGYQPNGVLHHSLVYDEKLDRILVFAGIQEDGFSSKLNSDVYAFYVRERVWVRLPVRLSPFYPLRYLQTVHIIGDYVILFGGNAYAEGDCFSHQIIAFHLRCNEYVTLNPARYDTTYSIGRHSHLSFVHDRYFFVFGGFNGLMLDNMFKLDVDPCSWYSIIETCSIVPACQWLDEFNRCASLDQLGPTIFQLNSKEASCCSLCSSAFTPASCSQLSDIGCFWCFKSGTCEKSLTPEFATCNPVPMMLDKLNELCYLDDPCIPETFEGANTCESCRSLTLENGNKCNWCHDDHTCIDRVYDTCNLYSYANMTCLDECQYFVDCNSCIKNPNCHWCTGAEYCQNVDKFCEGYLSVPITSNCPIPCFERETCSECTSSPDCVWCDSVEVCTNNNIFFGVFPFGRCSSYSHGNENCAVPCHTFTTCSSCAANPTCGWCVDENNDNGGFCQDSLLSANVTETPKCDPDRWALAVSQCSLPPSNVCECSGHSETCVDGQCRKCRDNTANGPFFKCESCLDEFIADTSHNLCYYRLAEGMSNQYIGVNSVGYVTYIRGFLRQQGEYRIVLKNLFGISDMWISTDTVTPNEKFNEGYLTVSGTNSDFLMLKTYNPSGATLYLVIKSPNVEDTFSAFSIYYESIHTPNPQPTDDGASDNMSTSQAGTDDFTTTLINIFYVFLYGVLSFFIVIVVYSLLKRYRNMAVPLANSEISRLSFSENISALQFVPPFHYVRINLRTPEDYRLENAIFQMQPVPKSSKMLFCTVFVRYPSRDNRIRSNLRIGFGHTLLIDYNEATKKKETT